MGRGNKEHLRFFGRAFPEGLYQDKRGRLWTRFVKGYLMWRQFYFLTFTYFEFNSKKLSSGGRAKQIWNALSSPRL